MNTAHIIVFAIALRRTGRRAQSAGINVIRHGVADHQLTSQK
jgi:hypothetical protein